MKIIFLASDSQGVRSMATFIDLGTIRIAIDPSAALGPRRFGLPPHAIEYEALESAWEKIIEYASEADIIIITHYHYDHFSRNRGLDIFRDKILIIKDPTKNINNSQRWRAKTFLKAIEGKPKTIIIGDGKELVFGDYKIRLSEPIAHGEPGTKLGYVLSVLVEGDKKFLFTSDVEGFLDPKSVNFVLSSRPNIIYVDGPPVYLGPKAPPNLLELSKKSFSEILKLDGAKIIIDHHFLRDMRYREHLDFINMKNAITAAEYMNKKPNLLEARRRELWELDKK